MNWIKENKFIAGFGAFMLVALGVLVFLLLSANGKFAEVSDTYASQSAELKRLQAISPYPDDENLQKVVQQKNDFVAKIAALQEKVAAMQFPAEPMSPSSFQSSLKAAVNDVATKAAANGVKLPDGFYLGFQDYQSSPPRNEAAAALGQQLQAIKLVVDALLNTHVSEITAIARDPLPQEAKSPAAATTRPMTPAAARAAASVESKLLTKETFQIAFLAEPTKFHQALNAISSTNEQFMVIKNIRIHNEQLKGPSRVVITPGDINQTAGAAPGATAADGDNSGNSWLKPIVGREKVNVTLDLEIIDFAKPAGKTAAK